MDDLLNYIQTKQASFSKGQKLIATYLINNYEKAAFMTASRLGETVGTSESTVVRFAFELGFEGYPELQEELQKLIRNKLTSVQRMEVATSKLENADILSVVLNSDIEKIKRTCQDINKEDFGIAIELIQKAKTIYILGVRSSSALANFLAFYFNLLFVNVKLIQTNSASEMFEQLLRVSSDDVVIGISYPRYSKRTVNALEYCASQNAKIIALTDSSLSPVAKFANITLVAYSDMTSFVDSLVAPLSLINSLIVAVALKKKDEVSKTLTNLEDVWDKYDVYEKFPGDYNE
ncbi:MAG: MurR/RpiR family transcriptional regulator [Clostridia bacterium]